MIAMSDLRGSKGYVKHPLASLSSAQPALFHFVPGAGSVLPPANTDPGGYKMKRSWLILRGPVRTMVHTGGGVKVRW